MGNFFYKLKSKFLKWVAEIRFYKGGVVFFGESHYTVTGEDMRRVLDCVQEGDVLIRRYSHKLGSVFIPGHFSHAALYVGNNKIIHSIGSGVQEDDILHFCRCDSISILRVPNINVSEISIIIKKAVAMKNNHVKYDFDFRKGNDTYYCTEFIDVCMEDLFEDDYKMKFGRLALTPDNMFASDKIDNFLTIRH